MSELQRNYLYSQNDSSWCNSSWGNSTVRKNLEFLLIINIRSTIIIKQASIKTAEPEDLRNISEDMLATLCLLMQAVL